MHIAADGWSLVEHPWSVEALHLLEWLGWLGSVDPTVRLSLVHPPGDLTSLPEAVQAVAARTQRTAWGRLQYEQRRLPRLAGALGADWLFLPHGAAPLASPVPAAVLIGRDRSHRTRSLIDRLRGSLGKAGAGGAARRLRYADQAAGRSRAAACEPVPPFLGELFRPQPAAGSQVRARWGLEPGYVLSCAPAPEQLEVLLAAWSWVEGSVGEAAPLVLTGLEPALGERARTQAEAMRVADSLRLAPASTLQELSSLYQAAGAYLHIGLERSGQPLRWALGTGVPVAGVDQPGAASIVGPAGYLVAAGDARRLGAACLTLLVEEPVATEIRQKGLLRATDWRGAAPLPGWQRIFHQHLQ